MITTVTHHRLPLFTDIQTGRCVVKALQEASSSARTLAFVVMPDHLHWLMQLNEGYSLSQSVQFVKSTSSRLINRSLSKTGRVWSKGYYDQTLRREDDIIGYARYIVANPLRAGLCRSVRYYPLWDAIWL
ncbi:transposase [Marinobacterium sp. CAU 1594]|nr:transposase [Marinobacterium arenosum]